MQDLFALKMPLSIGTMFWGDTPLDEWMAGRIIPDETLIGIHKMAHERGVTFLDTAEGYGVGSSEARLGRLGFAASDNLVATKFLPTLLAMEVGRIRESHPRLQPSPRHRALCALIHSQPGSSEVAASLDPGSRASHT